MIYDEEALSRLRHLLEMMSKTEYWAVRDGYSINELVISIDRYLTDNQGSSSGKADVVKISSWLNAGEALPVIDTLLRHFDDLTSYEDESFLNTVEIKLLFERLRLFERERLIEQIFSKENVAKVLKCTK